MFNIVIGKYLNYIQCINIFLISFLDRWTQIWSDIITYYYRPKRSFGQGNNFTPVCHSFCSQGGVSAPNFRGGLLQFFGGGVCSNFWGEGCLLQIFGGGVCSKFSGGSPIFRIRSTFGRYASYWNAFLLYIKVSKILPKEGEFFAHWTFNL